MHVLLICSASVYFYFTLVYTLPKLLVTESDTFRLAIHCSIFIFFFLAQACETEQETYTAIVFR